MIRKIIFGYVIGFLLAIICIIIFIYFYTKKIEKIVDKIDKQEKVNSIVNTIPISSEIKLIKVNNLQSVNIKFNKNKVVFLNFWATWCKPCLEELPSVIELYKKNKNKVDFFIISNEGSDKIMKLEFN